MRLESLERFGWRFGLESIQALLSEVGHPERSLRVIHVAGSNGKGSTCAFAASFLKQCGYKTGLYTSPHLCDIRERFRINGAWISRTDFQHHTRIVLAACRKVERKLGHSPTHFEALTAIAFSWFAEQRVEWLVLEVGLGGRLDATNVIPWPALCLITPVSLEHQDILGRTLGAIALEKAGILKPGCLAATVQTQGEALKAIKKAAWEKGTPLWVGGEDFRFHPTKEGFHWEGPGLSKSFHLRGLPLYQVANASLAVAGIQGLKHQGYAIEEGLIEKSFQRTQWPGRLEILQEKPLVVLDGAHNPDAAQSLRRSLEKLHPRKKWLILNGFLNDKNYTKAARILAPLAALAIATEPPSERREKASVIFRAWEKAGVRTLAIRDWSEALRLSLQKLKASPVSLGLLLTGSLYLGGACRKALVGLRGLEKI